MRILHLADLHWRNYFRHQEFNEVLQTLCAVIEKQKPDIIIIPGDIFDAKTILSSESVIHVVKMMEVLASYCDVYVIDGNHDLNLSNKERKSALAVVQEYLKHNKSYHFYNKSGIYPIGNNHHLGVFAITDLKDNYPIEIPNKDPNGIYIALYHGTLQGCSNEDNYKIESDNNPSELFKNYDFAMLGDIHNRQFLDAYEVEMEINEEEVDEYKHELGFTIIE